MSDILNIGIDSSKVVSGAAIANTAIDSVERNVNQLSKTLAMAGVGTALSAAVTIPVVSLGRTAVSSFSRFDKAIINSQSIVANVTAEMDADMRSLANTMSTEIPIAADKIAESYYFLASAGLNVQQQIATMPVVADFSTAGMFNMATATDLLTDAQSALGMTVADSNQNMLNMTEVGDAVVRTSQLANASIEQFSESLTNDAATTMRQFNIELDDGLAALAVYADQGIKGQVAGSSLARSIRLMTKAVSANNAEWDKLGLSIYDTTGDMLPLSEITGQLEDALAGMSTEMKVATLETLGFEARAQNAILPLIGMSEKMEELTKEIEAAGGAMDDVAEKQGKSLIALWTRATNAVDNFYRSLADSLEPLLRTVAVTVRVVFEALSMLPTPLKAIVSITGILAAVAGPLLITLAGVGALMASWPAIIASVSTAIAGLTAALSVFSGVMMVVLSELALFGALTAGVVAVAAGLYVAFNAVYPVIEAVAVALYDVFEPLIDLVTEIGSVFVDVIGGAFTVLMAPFKAIAGFVWLIGKGLKLLMQVGLSPFVGAVKLLHHSLSALVSIPYAIADGFAFLRDTIIDVGSSFLALSSFGLSSLVFSLFTGGEEAGGTTKEANNKPSQLASLAIRGTQEAYKAENRREGPKKIDEVAMNTRETNSLLEMIASLLQDQSKNDLNLKAV